MLIVTGKTLRLGFSLLSIRQSLRGPLFRLRRCSSSNNNNNNKVCLNRPCKNPMPHLDKHPVSLPSASHWLRRRRFNHQLLKVNHLCPPHIRRMSNSVRIDMHHPRPDLKRRRLQNPTSPLASSYNSRSNSTTLSAMLELRM